MPSDKPKINGIVQAARGNGFFSVLLDIEGEEKTILCQLSGKMRTNNIKVVEGDKVDVELGRIIYRRK